LHVRRDRQRDIQPAVISHGWNRPRQGYSPLQDAFDWPGTFDPTPWLCVGHAIRFLEDLLPGGLPELMRRNHDLVLAGRRILCQRLGLTPVGTETMLSSMAAMLLPNTLAERPLSHWERVISERPLSHWERVRVRAVEANADVPPSPPAPLPKGDGSDLLHDLLFQRGIEVPVYFWPSAPQMLLRISTQAYNHPAQYEQLADVLAEML